ncbi:hypothetical protein SSP24_66730 [Streptomyces spinoverrucosus]|uniref:Uncharacterized protein n=1 Tax=Streptomyces spinoverrucosus TaxID=284043 RepID=A0A4Y3VS22_9ACTN|nr:hypothetical protein [Streptomyces spinoverrucosus]GEC09018.1 hypothetical protein SSP24_66730 [Streptomyces spinoverrucosus]GHB66266.1 hypothetical protein GCM10010397_40500 [Streptomyces spinoverrucosus]
MAEPTRYVLATQATGHAPSAQSATRRGGDGLSPPEPPSPHARHGINRRRSSMGQAVMA